MRVFELCLNLPFHAFLQCFCFAPYGTTNPWSQTGSMRVRGQRLLYDFFLLFYPPTYLPPSHFAPLSPLPAETLNHPHQLQSILLFITFSSTLDTAVLLPPPTHLSCCPIWCCLSNCQYSCPMRSYSLAPVTPVCEAAPVGAPFMMLAHALVTLFVCCQYRTVCIFWCLCDIYFTNMAAHVTNTLIII